MEWFAWAGMSGGVCQLPRCLIDGRGHAVDWLYGWVVIGWLCGWVAGHAVGLDRYRIYILYQLLVSRMASFVVVRGKSNAQAIEEANLRTDIF